MTDNATKARESIEDARKILIDNGEDHDTIERRIGDMLKILSASGIITQTYDTNWRTDTDLFVSFVATDDLAHIQHEWLEFDHFGAQDDHNKAYDRAMRGI